MGKKDKREWVYLGIKISLEPLKKKYENYSASEGAWSKS